MTIRLVYRSSGKENTKPRPGFYSKILALASFLRAVDRCDEVTSVVFLNDAPIPRDTLDMMGEAGEVVNQAGLNLARSYREAVTLPVSRGWPGSDVAYISEDDYLFRPEAFVRLADASRDIPEADYFAFYATPDPAGRRFPASGGVDWRVAKSTTSSFGARISTLAADRWFHLLGCRAQGDFDRAICGAYSGRRPYRWNEVLPSPNDLHGVKTNAARIVGRAALNLGSYRARRQPRLLVTEKPSLATHMEEPHLAEGVDWGKVAAETARWAEQRGYRLPATGLS